MQNFSHETRRQHLGQRAVDRIILKQIFEKHGVFASVWNQH
jgi:hypothetical protein